MEGVGGIVVVDAVVRDLLGLIAFGDDAVNRRVRRGIQIDEKHTQGDGVGAIEVGTIGDLRRHSGGGVENDRLFSPLPPKWTIHPADAVLKNAVVFGRSSRGRIECVPRDLVERKIDDGLRPDASRVLGAGGRNRAGERTPASQNESDAPQQ